ncbi:MAG TPA: serine hydrolase [Bacteroidales bacterium]|nr:serine hydrolase [Bacteroidales bacterium]
MKEKVISLVNIGFAVFFSINCHSQVPVLTPVIEKRIQQVENNLLSWVQTRDTLKWSLESRMRQYNVAGLSIAVINDNKIEWAKGYGWADIAEKRPVTTETLFQAASISKSLNSLGVLALVQDKKLSLDADINDYLKTWKFPYDTKSNNKKITIANLLSHTAGLSVHGFPGYAVTDQLPSLVDILDGKKPCNTQSVRSVFEPGLRFQYSGGGIEILQAVVTDVTGEPYDKYMADHVLVPLNMKNSFYTQPPPFIKKVNLATGYRNDGKEIEGKYHVYPEQAAAGLWTNPIDLCKYILDTQNSLHGKKGKVLTSEMTKLRLTPYDGMQAGFGVFIEKHGNGTYFTHSGGNEGFRCVYIASMDEGKGLVVMLNSDNGNILNKIMNSVATVYDWKNFYNPVTKEVISLADSIKNTYTGRYELQGIPVTIAAEDGQMMLDYRNMKVQMFFVSPTEFFMTELQGNNRFIINSAGKVTGFFINGNTLVKKVK